MLPFDILYEYVADEYPSLVTSTLIVLEDVTLAPVTVNAPVTSSDLTLYVFEPIVTVTFASGTATPVTVLLPATAYESFADARTSLLFAL